MLLFEVPPAPRGIPISWNGHYYARNGESLGPLDLNKLDHIRQQDAGEDWSAAVVPEATLEHLDPEALAAARAAFATRHPRVDPQVKRFLPLPDYDLTEPGAVKLTIYGAVIDANYSEQLMQHSDLALDDVLALDRVQKKLPISGDAATRLKRVHLVEGRRPHLHVSSVVAAAADTKADYIRTRAQDDTHYAKLVTDYLTKFGEASRQDITDLLWDKLSDALDEKQKRNKVMNLLAKMRKAEQIHNTGSRSKPRWALK